MSTDKVVDIASVGENFVDSVDETVIACVGDGVVAIGNSVAFSVGKKVVAIASVDDDVVDLVGETVIGCVSD